MEALLQELRGAGLTIWALDGYIDIEGDLTDDQAAVIRANKPELLKILQRETPSRELAVFRAVGAEAFTGMDVQDRIDARSEELKQMMADDDDESRTYYFLTDTESHPDYVILAMAKRDVATWEFYIEREKYDVGVLLDLIKQIERNHLKGATI